MDFVAPGVPGRCVIFVSLALALAVPLSGAAGEDSPSGFAVKVVSRGVNARPIQMRFIGSDPSPLVEQVLDWANVETEGDAPAGVPILRKLVYRQIYPGVDLITYTIRGKVQYDLIVSPGADLDRVRILYEGFENIELTAELPGYQIVNGARIDVPVTIRKVDNSSYQLVARRYNSSVQLVIPTTSVPMSARSPTLALMN